ncbi:MAG TPA: long-chain fatty acid--CoA ligase [Candidatus Dormibacteraeota bacterium]|nr:long-chain fatty acid--CoA ligase [Candidatus Dormibacteraeota bacterium]
MANDHGCGRWMTRRAELMPSARALVWTGGETDQSWTYAELNGRINAMAHGLRALGVNAGDRVGYLDLNHPDFFVTMYAAAKLGAIFVPLNFRLTAPELAFMIGDAGIHTLVHDASFEPMLEGMGDALCCRHLVRTTGDGAASNGTGGHTIASVIAGHPETDMDNQVAESDVALIMYTSGTTGRPKGAMLTHANLLWNNVNAWVAFDTSATDITLVCAPLFHIGGLNVTPISAFTKGAAVVLMRSFDPAKVLDLIERHRVTSMFGVPAMFQFMTLVPGFTAADLSSVRLFICGGAPVPEPLIRVYGDRGIVFVQGYGLTETAPFVTIVPATEAATRIGSAGLPPFFTDVRLLDDGGREVTEPGVRGEIAVRGPNVMKGYWNRPDATAEVIVDGWFHTGDVGVRDADGYYAIVDRKKDLIISGGENVYPAEVEDVIYAHPEVAECAVVGIPDERWGEAVCAVVVARAGTSPSVESILEHTGPRLARYKQPRRVVFVEALPRNAAGKVLKFELRELYASSPADAVAGPAS